MFVRVFLFFGLALAAEIVSAEWQFVAAEIHTHTESTHTVVVDTARIDVQLDDAILYPKRDALLQWVARSAQVVRRYYGHFPVEQVSLRIGVAEGVGVQSGRQYGGKLPRVEVTVGKRVWQTELRSDWIMVHELVHLALAELPKADRWLAEGVAVYVAAQARAWAGDIDEVSVWREFLNGIPTALGGDASNERAIRARTYWGGALFCLLADVEIRERTSNRKSLNDALRAITNEGYSTTVRASAPSVLAVGDAAVGVDVLLPLYRKLEAGSVAVDFAQLLRSLGVNQRGSEIHFDDAAPRAQIRRSMFGITTDGR